MTEPEKNPKGEDEVQRALAPVSQSNLPILSERFQPKSLTELLSWAKLVTASGMAPKGMNEPGIVLAVQMGAELGITPAQAIQNIAVINGRPSIFGDLGLALFRRDAKYKTFEEDAPDVALKQGFGRCKIVMQDGTEIERRFSIEEAKAAKLWGKTGPWSDYPGRMLMFRARWWAMRDADGGVFKGCSAREELYEVIRTEDGGELEVQRPQARNDFKEVEGFVKETGKGGPAPAAGRPAPADPPPEIPNPFVDVLADLKKKSSKPGAKKKWTLWILKTETGEEFTTFDKKVAEQIGTVGKGNAATIRWELDDMNKRKAVEVAAHEESPAAEPEGGGFSQESLTGTEEGPGE
jgi:hypothetical protein